MIVRRTLGIPLGPLNQDLLRKTGEQYRKSREARNHEQRRTHLDHLSPKERDALTTLLERLRFSSFDSRWTERLSFILRGYDVLYRTEPIDTEIQTHRSIRNLIDLRNSKEFRLNEDWKDKLSEKKAKRIVANANRKWKNIIKTTIKKMGKFIDEIRGGKGSNDPSIRKGAILRNIRKELGLQK